MCGVCDFGQFYDSFVPLLHYIIVTSTGKDDRFFRGRAMECLTMIGLALPERFAPDAIQLMTVLVALFKSDHATDPDDPFRSYVLSAWSRICSVLKKEFIPFLPEVVPIVLAAAKLDPQLNLGQHNSDDDDDDFEDTLDAAEGGGEKYSLKTSILEEKANGCSMLCSFASDLELDFFPYVDATAQVLLPCITYTFNQEVRSFSVSAMAPLMKSAVLALQAGQTTLLYVQQLFEAMMKEIVNAFKIEDDITVLVTLTQCLGMIIEEGKDVTNQVLDAERLRIVGGACLKLLENSCTRMTERDAAKAEPEFDEEAGEEIEMENDADSELNFHICTALNVIIKTQQHNFLAICDLIVPSLMKLAVSGNEEFEKVAFYIWDDLIEFCGPAAAVYVEPFMPFVLKCANHESILVRQPACYGLGVCARFVSPQIMAPFCSTAVQQLVASARREDAREEMNRACTDNAVSSLAKFAQYQGGLGVHGAVASFDVHAVVAEFLQLLPLQEDETEGPNVYTCLALLMEMYAILSSLFVGCCCGLILAPVLSPETIPLCWVIILPGCRICCTF